MRIVNNQSRLVLLKKFSVGMVYGSALALMLGGIDVHAADAPVVSSPPMVTPMVSPSAPAAPSAPIVNNAATPSSPTMTMPAKAGDDLGKAVAAQAESAMENGKNATKHLEASSDSLTMEDMNSARQSIARIDLMIELEKHMAELDKVRSEHGGGMMPSAATSLANTIPASALTPPTRIAIPAMSSSESEPFNTVVTGYDVVRITGNDGKYVAILKMPNGDKRPVRVGDRVGASTVRWISASALELGNDQSSKVLHVKNVDMVYSASR